MVRRATQETIDKIGEWEGVRLSAYDDATGEDVKPGDIVQGTLTIGMGHTGPDVMPGQTITKAAADALLAQDLNRAEICVDGAVKVQLSDRQYGALVSFTDNAGVGAFLGSTLLKKLNAGGYDAVPGELMKWTKTTIAGRLVNSPGLVTRRANEAAYWNSGSEIAPALLAQQGAVAQVDPGKWVSLESAGSAIGGMGGLGALSGLVMGSGPVQWALAACFVIGFELAAYFFVTRRLMPK